MRSSAPVFAPQIPPHGRADPLEGRYIGLDETGDGIWSIYFRDVLLGRYHEEERKVAGRKAGPNPLVRHRRRPTLASRHPCHVTLRVREGVPSLRAPAFVRVLEETLTRGCERGEFRLVHYALLRDHAHLIVEAKDRHALSRGMMSLSKRMIWAMRRAFGWRGGLLADRYHLRVLKTPREVRNAIR